MKKSFLFSGAIAMLIAGALTSCKKTETTNISKPPVIVGKPIPAGNIPAGSYSGTMTTGSTYNIQGDFTINQGDTVLIQSGVTICVQNTSTIIVKGVLLSIGTQASPVTFTACNVTPVNTIAQAESPSTDPAWNGGLGWWTGINCDTTCTLLVLKWTHINYTGAAFPVTENFSGGKQGSTSYGVLFQNPNGQFVMEDCWMYGGIDDAVRIENGKISIMRNTYEKMGYIGGDCLNAKSGSVGDMAYNLFVGCATNGTKASNKGGISPECNINMYNNTYVDCGYRQDETGRGADIDYEQGAEGMSYNNLIVNCKFGFRIVGNPAADTIHCFYSNNYAYGDSLSVVDQFYPVGYITHPGAYIIPNPATTNYVYSGNGAAAYNDSVNIQKNNPMFVNFPLPEPNIVHLYDIDWTAGYNFHLQTGSPALGQGYTNFSAIAPIQIANSAWAPTVTPPGVDIGCYQSNGTGNQH